MNDQHNKMSFTDFQLAVNFVSWLSHLFGVAVNVFLHRAPGERYIGIPGLMIIPITVVYAMLTQRYGGAVLLAFVPVYCVMCLIWRAYAIYRHKKLRRPVHTRYAGKPWLCFLMPWWQEETVLQLEPMFVMLAGAAVSTINPPLGVYIVAAGIGQGVSLAIAMMIRHAKELDQMDAMLEQKQLAESTREILA